MLGHLLHQIIRRPALLVAPALLMIFVLGFASVMRPRPPAKPGLIYTNSPAGPTTVIERPHVPVSPVFPAQKPAPIAAKPPQQATPQQALPQQAIPRPTPPPARPFTGCSIHANVPPETNMPSLNLYAPAGRLLRCQLVNSVDSANIDTPIIALITDDLWHEGQIIIPAGTEVHGRASVNRLRERIVASGSWTLVWQSGEELVVSGIALDREELAGGQWSITDGSAGLRGQILRSDSMAEIKLFIATFVSAAASGLQDRTTTLLGDQIARTTKNAALEGASEVMNRYAQQMLETIQREGIFVRVPAGKEMYLYVTATIDLANARKGNLRAPMPPQPFTHLNVINGKS